MVEDLKTAYSLLEYATLEITEIIISKIRSLYAQSSSLVSAETFALFTRLTTESDKLKPLSEEEVKSALVYLAARKKELLSGG
jgi:hypothetical protein